MVLLCCRHLRCSLRPILSMKTLPQHQPAPAAPAGPLPMPATGTETATLNIEGMTCASFSNFVEKALSRTPGVKSATVNLASERPPLSTCRAKWTAPA